MLLLEDHQLRDENLIECVNSLLSAGELPGLFEPQELEPLLAPLKEKYGVDLLAPYPKMVGVQAALQAADGSPPIGEFGLGDGLLGDCLTVADEAAPSAPVAFTERGRAARSSNFCSWFGKRRGRSLVRRLVLPQLLLLLPFCFCFCDLIGVHQHSKDMNAVHQRTCSSDRPA